MYVSNVYRRIFTSIFYLPCLCVYVHVRSYPSKCYNSYIQRWKKQLRVRISIVSTNTVWSTQTRSWGSALILKRPDGLISKRWRKTNDLSILNGLICDKVEGKPKDVPVLSITRWRRGSTAPSILSLNTRLTWAFGSTLRPLYPGGKSPRHPLYMWLVGFQRRSGRGGGQKNLSPHLESNPRRPTWQWYVFEGKKYITATCLSAV